MKYLINNEIIYESDSRLLSHAVSPENNILLSETAGRLLTHLLDEPNTVLTRNNIIHDVWDKYGYTGSGNSLNQYISLLRRNFALLGCKEIIQTIPKLGFSLNATVTLCKAAEIRSPEDVCQNKGRPVAVAAANLPSKTLCSRFMLVCISLLTLLCVAYLLRLLLSNMLFSERIENVQLHQLGSLNGCSVFTTSPFSSAYRQTAMNKINQLAEGHFSCVGGTFLIFDAEDLYVFNSTGSAFLTACTFENKNTEKLTGCRDIYVSN